MIEVINNEDADILEVEFIETFTKSDLEHLMPVVEKHVAETEHPLLIISMLEFEGWDEAETFWEDMKLDATYINSFERIAVLGDKKWEEWMTKLVQPFASGKIKFFDHGREKNAHRWLREAKR